ncbi:hypothetical protein [Pseudomonas citri]|uniref:hypothetical protein n=1 Tax=Pseudomonas citri TaxID=2978349 RepID=UPI0021B5C251|nr:hypothetical protein [Pseudomonas citri]
MQKQPARRNIPAAGSTVSRIAAECERDIYFCSPPTEDGGPVIKPGQKVTYELMLGSDGQYYAVNLELISKDP